jgi:hypothetical protein
VALTIIVFQVPLFNLLSFGNNSFLDTKGLPSVALLSGYCLMVMVQVVFLFMNKSIDVPEITVYGLLLLVALIVTGLMYYAQYLTGIDGMKNYILNLVGLSVSAVQVVYEMLHEMLRGRPGHEHKK